MRKIMITSPLTGISAPAIEYLDGTIVFTDKLTGEDVRLTYNSASKRYMLDPKYIGYSPILTFAECADILGVSVQRLYRLIERGRLECIESGDKRYITESSALKCKYELSQDKRSKSHGARTD